MAWLPGYNYRKQKGTNGSTAGAQTDYQKRAVLHYGDGHQLTGWTKDAVNNPILNPAAMTLCWPAIVYSGGTYYLYLGGPVSGYDTRLWTSGDGITFVEHGSSPVIVRGGGGSWDDDMLEPHSVVWETAAMAAARYNGGAGEGGANPCWRLYYGGFDGSVWKIGYAWSTDLVSWDKYDSNPVISPTGNETRCADPHAIVYGGTLYMYYAVYTTAKDEWQLHGAYSSDGHSFTKYGSNPIKRKIIPGAFYAFGNGIAAIWFDAHDNSNCIAAWSTDGEHWVEYSENPILELGAGGQWDDVYLSHCDIIKVGSTYWLYYAAYDGIDWQIGRASTTSDDEGTDISLESHSLPDFGDVRFTKNDGSTELAYWLKRKIDSKWAEFCVEVDSIPASPGSDTIYVYYGKAGALTTSDIKAASLFSHADDFNDNARDVGLWDLFAIGTGIASETNQRLEMGCPANADCSGFVSVSAHAISNILIQVLAHNPTLQSVDLYLCLTKVTSSHPQSENDWYRVSLYQNGGLNNLLIQKNVGGGGAVTLYQQGWFASEEILLIKKTGGTIKFFEAEPHIDRASDAWALPSTSCYIYLIGRGVTGDLGTDWVDTFWIQKYVVPEPTWGASGGEEPAVGGAGVPSSGLAQKLQAAGVI